MKKSEIITYEPKTFEDPSTVHIKPVIAEHLKVEKAEQVASISSLYSDTKMSENFFK